MSRLEDARKEINAIDEEMAKLFERRMNAVKDVAEYKKENGMQVFDSSREQQVIERNSNHIVDETLKSYYVKFLQDMMDVSKSYQHQLIKGARIAYSGVEGAFAAIASRKIFPDGEMVAFTSFSAAYNAVVNGDCEFAVLPIENSFAGEVGQVMDLMFNGSLYVRGVYSLKVSQNLLGVPGATVSSVKKVVSHPQALDQCADYIAKHGFERIQSSNTARAAMQVAELKDKSIAAIASAETAAIYNLEIIDHDINESDWNATKFAVFSRIGTVPKDEDRKSFMMLFTVKNEAGALARALDTIGEHNFNMRVLRSRPLKGLAWTYYFYVEAEGQITQAAGDALLDDLKEHCEMLKIYYPNEGNI